jgi:ribonuclease P protein component
MSISFQPEQQTLAPSARKVRQSLAGARLRKHADFQSAYAAAGRKRRSASMSWFLAPQSEPAGSRVGLTVGKVLGKAHERNRIKRRLRDVLRRHVELLPGGCDLILHPHRTVLTMDFTKLEAEILRILQQANAELARANLTRSPRSSSEESAQ